MPDEKNIQGLESLFGSSVPKTLEQSLSEYVGSEIPNRSHTSSQMIGEYIVDQEIGKGSFATVFKAHHKQSNSNEFVAIKVIERQKLNKKLLENLSLEISILKSIRHPNIVRLYEVYHSNRFVYLIMEYCAGGDLAYLLSIIRKEKKKKRKETSFKVNNSFQQLGLDESIVQRFVFDLGSALECLRSHSLIHRDLKPQNLLLSQNTDLTQAILKIADFGFARYVSTNSMADTLCGSPLYMAPEILRYEKYDAKADLWSVGAITYEMIFGKPPFRAQNHLQLLKKIDSTPITDILPIISSNTGLCHSLPNSLSQQYPIPQHGTDASPICIDLLQCLLRKNPLERIGFEEFFMHPFLRKQTNRNSRQDSIPIPKSKPLDVSELHIEESKINKHNIIMIQSSISSSSSRRKKTEQPSSASSSWQPPILLGSGESSIHQDDVVIEASRHKRQQSSPTMTRIPFASRHYDSITNPFIQYSSSVGNSTHWTYLGEGRRNHLSVTTLSESIDKDFVIVDKPPPSMPMGINIPSKNKPTSEDITPGSSPSNSFPYHSSYPDTYFPLSHLTRRISIPIPGYTRPRDYGVVANSASSEHYLLSSKTSIPEEQEKEDQK